MKLDIRAAINAGGSILQGQMQGAQQAQQQNFQDSQAQFQQNLGLAQMQHGMVVDQANREEAADQDAERNVLPNLPIDQRGPFTQELAQHRAARNQRVAQSGGQLTGLLRNAPGSAPLGNVLGMGLPPGGGMPSPNAAGPALALSPPPSPASGPAPGSGSPVGAMAVPPGVLGASGGGSGGWDGSGVSGGGSASGAAPMTLPGFSGHYSYIGQVPKVRTDEVRTRLQNIARQEPNLVGMSPYEIQQLQQDKNSAGRMIHSPDDLMAAEMSLNHADYIMSQHGPQGARAGEQERRDRTVELGRRIEGIKGSQDTYGAMTELPDLLDAIKADKNKYRDASVIDKNLMASEEEIEQIRKLRETNPDKAQELAGIVLGRMAAGASARMEAPREAQVQKILAQADPVYLSAHPEFTRKVYATHGLGYKVDNLTDEELGVMSGTRGEKAFEAMSKDLPGVAKMEPAGQSAWLERYGQIARSLGVRASLPASLVTALTPESKARMAHLQNLDIQGENKAEIAKANLELSAAKLMSSENNQQQTQWYKAHPNQMGKGSAASPTLKYYAKQASDALGNYRQFVGNKDNELIGFDPEDPTNLTSGRPNRIKATNMYQRYQDANAAYYTQAKALQAPVTALDAPQYRYKESPETAQASQAANNVVVKPPVAAPAAEAAAPGYVQVSPGTTLPQATVNYIAQSIDKGTFQEGLTGTRNPETRRMMQQVYSYVLRERQRKGAPGANPGR